MFWRKKLEKDTKKEHGMDEFLEKLTKKTKNKKIK